MKKFISPILVGIFLMLLGLTTVIGDPIQTTELQWRSTEDILLILPDTNSAGDTITRDTTYWYDFSQIVGFLGGAFVFDNSAVYVHANDEDTLFFRWLARDHFGNITALQDTFLNMDNADTVASYIVTDSFLYYKFWNTNTDSIGAAITAFGANYALLYDDFALESILVEDTGTIRICTTQVVFNKILNVQGE